MTELNIKYIKSVGYPDKVTIKTWVSKYSRLRSVYNYEIYSEDNTLMTVGWTTLTCVDAQTFKPMRLDRYLPKWHEIYSDIAARNEAGETLCLPALP